MAHLYSEDNVVVFNVNNDVILQILLLPAPYMNLEQRLYIP